MNRSAAPSMPSTIRRAPVPTIERVSDARSAGDLSDRANEIRFRHHLETAKAGSPRRRALRGLEPKRDACQRPVSPEAAVICFGAIRSFVGSALTSPI